jgi:hypothetical protein
MAMKRMPRETKWYLIYRCFFFFFSFVFNVANFQVDRVRENVAKIKFLISEEKRLILVEELRIEAEKRRIELERIRREEERRREEEKRLMEDNAERLRRAASMHSIIIYLSHSVLVVLLFY